VSIDVVLLKFVLILEIDPMIGNFLILDLKVNAKKKRLHIDAVPSHKLPKSSVEDALQTLKKRG